MINILCYGDSNTWGHIAGTDNLELGVAKRFEYGVRWPTVLQKILGHDYHIIEAGLKGRNTSFDEKNRDRPTRNGMVALPGVLDSNYPLDLAIFMLGTNDLLIEFDASVERIVKGMRELIQYTKSSPFGLNFNSPDVLLVSPVCINEKALAVYPALFDVNSMGKAQQLSEHYFKLAEKEHCAFLDANSVVKTGHTDGVHLEKDAHKNLAKAISQIIKSGENKLFSGL